MPPRKSATRGDKQKSTTRADPVPQQPTTAPAEEAAAAPADETAASQASDSYLYFTFRQHIGFILGASSIVLTYFAWDEGDPNSVWRMVGCLLLCTIGLIFHELRPFKRRGYGDVAWERLTADPSAANVRAAMGR